MTQGSKDLFKSFDLFDHILKMSYEKHLLSSLVFHFKTLHIFIEIILNLVYIKSASTIQGALDT